MGILMPFVVSCQERVKKHGKKKEHSGINKNLIFDHGNV
jgi:hypothetical protein